MAFPTNQNLTTLLLQGLNVRTNANTPISSLYTIYANGIGQTFWGPSVNPVIMSSVFYSIATTYTVASTTTNNVYNTLSTSIVNSCGAVLSTSQASYSTLSSQIYITNYVLQSSVSSLMLADSTITAGIINVSTAAGNNSSTNLAFLNDISRSVYISYVSTINYVISTLYGVSSFSTFYNEIAYTQSTNVAGLSSLSTALYTQNASTYSSLTNNYNTAIQTAIVSTTNYTTGLFSTLSSYTVYLNQLSSFSSVITNQLLSTSWGMSYYISTNDAAINASLSSINSLSQSTASTVVTFNNAIAQIQLLSTNLSSITNSWISSFVSTSQYYQNSTIYSTIGVVSTNVSTVYGKFAQYSTITYSTISTMQQMIYKNSSDISSLQIELSTLTTSSILNGIYQSFIDLEIYSKQVIDANSTANAMLIDEQFVGASSTIYSEVVSTLSMSTLYTSQTIDLTGSNFVGTMDLATYRNFDVNVHDIVNNGSKYQLNYLSNVANSDLEYRAGNIFINISTVGQTYTPNNGKLRFDVYRYGFPSRQNESVFPLLGNGDYTLHYGYTIHNNTVFTNLLNAYPRLATYAINYIRLTTPSVILSYDGINPAVTDPSYFWRGERISVNWSNYSYFPFASTGYMNFNPEINVDVLANDNLIASYGPFSLGLSTTTVTMPYLSTPVATNGAIYTSPNVVTTIRAYIVGKPMEATELVLNTIQPCFTNMLMSTNGTNFSMGNELVGITDIGNFPLYNQVPVVTSLGGGTSYNNDPNYGGSNLFNGVLNQAGSIGFSNVLQPDPGNLFFNTMNTLFDYSYVNNYAAFYLNINGSSNLSNFITLQEYGSQVTATFTDSFSTISFVCEPITVNDYYGFYYAIFSNTSVNIAPQAYRWGVSENTLFTLSYTPLLSSYTTATYTESNYIGPDNPIGSGTPDASALLKTSVGGIAMPPYTYYYPLSTLTFYNITDNTAPTYNSTIAGNTITGYTYDGTTYYGSTFVLTNSQNAQVFKL